MVRRWCSRHPRLPRAHSLDNVERVTLCLGVKLTTLPLIQRNPGDGGAERGCLRLAEWLERNFLQSAFAGELADYRVEARLQRDFTRAKRGHHYYARGICGPQKPADPLEGLAVRPLQVVEEQQYRLGCRRDGMRHRLEETASRFGVWLATTHRAGARVAFRQNGCELGTPGLREPCDRCAKWQ